MRSQAKKSMNRRSFLKYIAAICAAIGFGKKIDSVSGATIADMFFPSKRYETDPYYYLYTEKLYSKNSKKKYGMVIDCRKCIGCHSCATACRDEFNVPPGVWRSWVKVIEKGEGEEKQRSFLPRLCNHCDHAPCVMVCPVRASFKRADGVVLIDYDKCIGCKYCITACPYDARFVNHVRKTVEKCTFCIHRIDKGLKPACVEICPVGARTFGDLNDPDSEVSKLIASNSVQTLKPELNTKPKVFYIGADPDIMGRIKISEDVIELVENYEKTYPEKAMEAFERRKEYGEAIREGAG